MANDSFCFKLFGTKNIPKNRNWNFNENLFHFILFNKWSYIISNVDVQHFVVVFQLWVSVALNLSRNLSWNLSYFCLEGWTKMKEKRISIAKKQLFGQPSVRSSAAVRSQAAQSKTDTDDPSNTNHH